MSILAERMRPEDIDSLARIVGGTQITVPASLTASAFNAGTLRDRVGDRLFALLVFHFGGTRIYVPQAETTRRTGQDPIDPKRIASLTKRGWSATRIARHLGCSERTVRGWRAKTRSINKLPQH